MMLVAGLSNGKAMTARTSQDGFTQLCLCLQLPATAEKWSSGGQQEGVLPLSACGSMLLLLQVLQGGHFTG